MRILIVLFCSVFLTACQSSISRFVEYRGLPKHSVNIIDEQGVESARIEVRSGECFVSADCSNQRERVELTTARTSSGEILVGGMERWYRFQLKFPYDWQPPYRIGGIIVAQIKIGGVSHPIFRLEVTSRNGVISYKWLSASLDHSWKWLPWSLSKGKRKTSLVEIDDLKGQWNDFVLRAKWTKNEDGFAYLWLNGKPIWSQSGANTARGLGNEVYQKTGIYRYGVLLEGEKDTSIIFVRTPTKGHSQSDLNLPYELDPFQPR
jgi:hypothetical protein